MGDTYHALQDDEVIAVDLDEPWIKLACCDCGLVHYWTFTLTCDEKGKLFLHVEVDRCEKSTAQKRRGGNCELLTNPEQRWTMIRK